MEENRFKVDPNDPRLTSVKAEGEAKITESNTMYDAAISTSDKAYDDAIGNYKIDANDGVTTATEAVIDAKNAQTEATVAQINQQKEQAKKDYLDTAANEYAEYREAVNPYGVNAEKIASMGLSNSGYSEGSKVAMYVAYQNAVATAKASLDQAIVSYDNMIVNARNQNSVEIAQIALEALEKADELAIQKIATHNQLVKDKADAQIRIEANNQTKYQSVLDQINTENLYNYEAENDARNYQLELDKYYEGIRQHDEEMDRLRANDEINNAYTKAQTEAINKELEYMDGLNIDDLTNNANDENTISGDFNTMKEIFGNGIIASDLIGLEAMGIVKIDSNGKYTVDIAKASEFTGKDLSNYKNNTTNSKVDMTVIDTTFGQGVTEDELLTLEAMGVIEGIDNGSTLSFRVADPERAATIEWLRRTGTSIKDYFDISNTPLKNRNFTMISGGGKNYFGGMDRNAKYQDGIGNQYTGAQLYNALVKDGMSNDKAKAFVIDLQKRTGASTKG